MFLKLFLNVFKQSQDFKPQKKIFLYNQSQNLKHQRIKSITRQKLSYYKNDKFSLKCSVRGIYRSLIKSPV